MQKAKNKKGEPAKLLTAKNKLRDQKQRAKDKVLKRAVLHMRGGK